jgi:hypothetical protein
VIWQNDLSPTGIVSRTKLYDYANAGCLGVGYRATWYGEMDISWDDSSFPMAFSASGPQETGFQIAVYKPGLGCRVLNTKTGVVTGQWGPTGTITSASRLLLHSASGAPDGVHVGYETNNCLAGSCTPQMWDVYGLSVAECGAALDCGGHNVHGMFFSVNGTGIGNWFSRSMEAPAYGISPAKSVPASLVAPNIKDQQHASWGNTMNDQQPIFASFQSTADTGIGKGFLAPWDGEIVGFKTPTIPGFSIPFREGHNFASGTCPNFVCQQAIGQVSHDGKYFVFATDFGTPRSYVAVMVLQ